MITVEAAPEVCEHCFGTGTDVSSGTAKPCACRTADRLAKLWRNTDLPVRYQTCTLQNYVPNNETQVRALTYASTLVLNYPVEKGLLLVGPVGVGKTHLAAGCLRSIVQRGYPGLFVEFGSLLKEIQRSYDANTQVTEWGVLARVKESPVLVLDEMGASRPTDWARDILYQVINTRYNQKLLTIITTNYGDDPGPTETLVERIGEPLRSRLFEMCQTIVLDGRDYRRKTEKTVS